MKVWICACCIALICVTANVDAAKQSDKLRCAKVKLKIREIEARMRQGYTASQGVKLEARLRKLKDERYRVCR